MSRTHDILKTHPEANPAKEALLAWEEEYDQLRETVSELHGKNEALQDHEYHDKKYVSFGDPVYFGVTVDYNF